MTKTIRMSLIAVMLFSAVALTLLAYQMSYSSPLPPTIPAPAPVDFDVCAEGNWPARAATREQVRKAIGGDPCALHPNAKPLTY
jgi:hypothetical protein